MQITRLFEQQIIPYHLGKPGIGFKESGSNDPCQPRRFARRCTGWILAGQARLMPENFKGKKACADCGMLGYSRDGLVAAWQNEAAFREEILLASITLPLAIYLGKTGAERALMLGSILLILIVEILNSAIEAVNDKASLKCTNWPSAPRIWAALPSCSA